MISNQVLEYIRQQKQQGVNDKDIKAALAVQGWLPQDLDEAFYLASSQTAATTSSPVPPPANPNASSAFAPPTSAPQTKPKAPIFVIIIAWLMLIGGVFSLLGVLPFLLIGGLGKSWIIFLLGALNLVRGVGLVVVSFGIRHMRRWALYTFTVLTILAVGVSIYDFVTSPKQDFTQFADVAIQALVLVYFWAISKRFV